MASIMTSMPLFGESRPNVRMTGLAAEAELRFGEMRVEKGNIGNAMRDHLDPLRRHAVDGTRRSSRPFSAMTTTFAEASMMPRMTSR